MVAASASSPVFSSQPFALDAGMVTADPTVGIENPVGPKSEGFIPWTEDDVAAYEKRWPVGTRQRVWLDVLLYTGLRRGDAVRLGRPHVRDGIATIKTEKTDTLVVIPILPALMETSGPLASPLPLRVTARRCCALCERLHACAAYLGTSCSRPSSPGSARSAMQRNHCPLWPRSASAYFRRACGWSKPHHYIFIAYRHQNLGRASLLRRADDAGYIGLGYLSRAAGHDHATNLAISTASDSLTTTSGSCRSALTISTSRPVSQLYSVRNPSDRAFTSTQRVTSQIRH